MTRIKNWLDATADYTYDHLRAIYLVLLLASIVAISILIGVGAYLYSQNHTRQKEIGHLVQENGKLIRRIQDERTASIIRGCTARNKRHDLTIQRLTEIYNETAKDLPAGQSLEALRQGEARTKYVINAIVPFEDCNKLAQQAVTATQNENRP